VPDGPEWRWDTENPVTGSMIGMAKQFALESGLDQAGFSKMIELFASHQLADRQRFNAARAA
jgi:hypothetical protein